MQLFLASETKHPDSLAALREFTGNNFVGKKMVYIATAANGEGYGSWRGGESWKVAANLGAAFSIVELEDFDYRDCLTPIREADYIWMAGGMSGYLLYWLRRTQLDGLLPQWLEQGKIYIGSSAGSMVCSKTQYLSEIYLGDNEPGASVIPGLGLVDFEIYPHYEDKMRAEIEAVWPKGKLYLVKNGEAITVKNGQIQVLGETRVIDK